MCRDKAGTSCEKPAHWPSARRKHARPPAAASALHAPLARPPSLSVPTANRRCQACTFTCPLNRYRSAPYRDSACSPCSTCDTRTQYQAAACNAGRNVICQPCGAGSYQVQPPAHPHQRPAVCVGDSLCQWNLPGCCGYQHIRRAVPSRHAVVSKGALRTCTCRVYALLACMLTNLMLIFTLS